MKQWNEQERLAFVCDKSEEVLSLMDINQINHRELYEKLRCIWYATFMPTKFMNDNTNNFRIRTDDERKALREEVATMEALNRR